VKWIALAFVVACDAERIDFTNGADASSLDAGGDASADVVPDAAIVSSPDAIACGPATCDPQSAFCCATPDGATTDLACQTSGGNCPSGGVIHCDEAADCPAGNVCCWDTSGPVVASDCHTDCTGGGGTRYQACKTNGECLTGTCAAHACANGLDVTSCAPVGTLCP
jgi:hypothetical protein